VRVHIALSALLFVGCQAAPWSEGSVASRATVPSTDIEHRCTNPPVQQIFYAGGSTGYVKQQHCLDSGPGFRYEYDAYEITSEGVSFIARSYVHEIDEAHFLRKVIAGAAFEIDARDVETTAFRRAAAYLRERGITRLRYLSLTNEGYVDVPD